MKGLLATRLNYSRCFITRLCHLIEQLSRIIKWHAPKVENLLTPAQIDAYVIHNTSFVICTKIYKTNPTFISWKNFNC